MWLAMTLGKELSPLVVRRRSEREIMAVSGRVTKITRI